MVFRPCRDYISLISERQQNFVTALIILPIRSLLDVFENLSFNIADGLNVFICAFLLG